MFYFIHGKDFEKRKHKQDALIEALKKKRPHSEMFALEPDGFEESALDELLFSQGLFDEKIIIKGGGLFTDNETKNIFLKRIAELRESPNVFVFWEVGLDKKTLQKIEKYAEKIFSTGGENKKHTEPFNSFLLADALGKKDKKNLWVLYQKSLRAGSKPEEVHGILFWQVKNMILVNKSKTAEEAGLKSFPYQKAKTFSRNFSECNLIRVSEELVSIYHDAHRGKFAFEDRLEQFILEL